MVVMGAAEVVAAVMAEAVTVAVEGGGGVAFQRALGTRTCTAVRQGVS